MIKIEKIKSKSANQKYQLRIDDKVFETGVRKLGDNRLVFYAPKGREGFGIEVEDPCFNFEDS